MSDTPVSFDGFNPCSYSCNIPHKGNKNPRRLNFDLSHGTKKSKENKLLVYLRLNPSCSERKTQLISIENETTVVTKPLNDQDVRLNFTFQKIFDQSSSQEDVFRSLKEACRKFIEGESTSVYSYGTSSSGKSFTLRGSASHPGFLPRFQELLFRSLKGRLDLQLDFYLNCNGSVARLPEAMKAQLLTAKKWILHRKPTRKELDLTSTCPLANVPYEEIIKNIPGETVKLNTNGKYSVWISAVEINHGGLFDLLTIQSVKSSLRFGTNEDGIVYLKGLSLLNVSSGEEAFGALKYICRRLKISSAPLNIGSSRSHCLISIHLVQRTGSEIKVSTFTVGDLAGNERQKTAVEQQKGANQFNLSHLVLNRCFRILLQNQARSVGRIQIPYRDSNLTKLMQHGLTQSMILIVNINMSANLQEETIQALKSSPVARSFDLKKKKTDRRKSRFTTFCEENVPNVSFDIQEFHNNSETLLLRRRITFWKEKIRAHKEEKVTMEVKLREEAVKTFSKSLEAEVDQYRRQIALLKKSLESQKGAKKEKGRNPGEPLMCRLVDEASQENKTLKKNLARKKEELRNAKTYLKSQIDDCNFLNIQLNSTLTMQRVLHEVVQCIGEGTFNSEKARFHQEYEKQKKKNEELSMMLQMGRREIEELNERLVAAEQEDKKKNEVLSCLQSDREAFLESLETVRLAAIKIEEDLKPLRDDSDSSESEKSSDMDITTMDLSQERVEIPQSNTTRPVTRSQEKHFCDDDKSESDTPMNLSQERVETPQSKTTTRVTRSQAKFLSS